MRILLAEDEALIAMDFRMEAEEQDIGHIVTVSTVSKALEKLAADRFDWGILDLNLKDGVTYPIADQLAAQGANICFISGSEIPPDMISKYGAAVFQKPVSMGAVCKYILSVGCG